MKPSTIIGIVGLAISAIGIVVNGIIEWKKPTGLSPKDENKIKDIIKDEFEQFKTKDGALNIAK